MGSPLTERQYVCGWVKIAFINQARLLRLRRRTAEKLVYIRHEGLCG